MLFLLEFKQLQQDMIKNEFIEDKHIWRCNINQDIVNNVCIDHTNIHECFQYISRIYDQYIEENAIAEINISYTIRNEITQTINEVLSKYNQEILQKLYCELEEAASEVFMLLFTDSFMRFSQTDQYKNWLNLTKPAYQIRERARSKSQTNTRNSIISPTLTTAESNQTQPISTDNMISV